MKNTDKTEIFESIPMPTAVAKLCIPTVLATLVMVLYNLADTFFVGELRRRHIEQNEPCSRQP